MIDTPVNPYLPRIEKLGNGAELLNAPSASRNVGVMLIVRAGSRDETPQTAGLAHFLEHMFFKGTERRPTTQVITREIDRLGASTNAYTSTEEVAYYAEGPATALDELADVITDMVVRPLFEPEEVDRERNVVLQELAARLLDPDTWVFDHIGAAAFGGEQPIAWSPGGSPTVISHVPRDELVAYHDSFYAPSSMALVVAGGASLTVQRADQLFEGLHAGSPKPRAPAQWGLGERWVANVRTFNEGEEPQVSMLLAVPGLRALDEERPAVAVMAYILGGGMSSRLWHTVRERNGLAYSIFAFNEAFDDTGLFAISTATRPKDAAKAVSLSFREFRRIAEERVDEDELEAAKSSMIGRLLRSTETAMASARFFAGRWRAGLPLETPDDRAAAIAQVTAADVQAVAQRVVAGLDDVRIALVGPDDQGEELLAATQRVPEAI